MKAQILQICICVNRRGKRLRSFAYESGPFFQEFLIVVQLLVLISVREYKIFGAFGLKASPAGIVNELAGFVTLCAHVGLCNDRAFTADLGWGLCRGQIGCGSPPRFFSEVNLLQTNHPTLEAITHLTPNVRDMKPAQDVVVMRQLRRTDAVALCCQKVNIEIVINSQARIGSKCRWCGISR